MNEMIGRMIGGETVVVNSALTDFLIVVAFAALFVLFTSFVLPYLRRNKNLERPSSPTSPYRQSLPSHRDNVRR